VVILSGSHPVRHSHYETLSSLVMVPCQFSDTIRKQGDLREERILQRRRHMDILLASYWCVTFTLPILTSYEKVTGMLWS
jgi:hypothetical protein